MHCVCPWQVTPVPDRVGPVTRIAAEVSRLRAAEMARDHQVLSDASRPGENDQEYPFPECSPTHPALSPYLSPYLASFPPLFLVLLPTHTHFRPHIKQDQGKLSFRAGQGKAKQTSMVGQRRGARGSETRFRKFELFQFGPFNPSQSLSRIDKLGPLQIFCVRIFPLR